MKKKLLLIILALAILTSLTAGTLAVYTKTVHDTEQIEAKRFAFSASGDIKGGSASINLAPTESMEYDFSIANADTKGGTVAEVPLEFAVTIDYAEAASKMPGLVATLYYGETEVGESTTGRITYSAQSEAGKSFDNTYRVVLTWGSGDNDAQTAAGSSKVSLKTGLTLTVVATQIT